MEYGYVKRKLGLKESRADFETDLDWAVHKAKVIDAYIKDREATGYIYRSNFYKIHDLKDYKSYFKKSKYRRLILLEKMCDRFRATGILPDRPRLLLEDFIEHLHWYKDTFNKSYDEIQEDLSKLDKGLKEDVLYSILYKDVYIGYLYRVSPRLGMYLRTGAIYSKDRISGKSLKRIDGVSARYFTKGEMDIINKMNTCVVGVVRDRICWYKDYYERMRQVRCE